MFRVWSISHHTAALDLREQVSLTMDQQAAWLARVRDAEAVVLSTCNRLELYSFSSNADDSLWRGLLAAGGRQAGTASRHAAHAEGLAAARHLFRVCCGLESMALGEPQILGQVTRAFEQAQAQGTAGPWLSHLFRTAIHSAKRARSETAISHGGASLSSLGIRHAEQALGALHSRAVVVIGAGEMGETMVKALVQRGVGNITIVSRTFDTARRLAAQWEVRARPITELGEALAGADVAFTTSSAPFTILTVADLAPIMARRPDRPLCLVDLAVPRDVAPDVTQVPGVCLYDLDDLQGAIDASREAREGQVPAVERIIEEELAAFWAEHQARAVAPTIRDLRARAEELRQAELSRIYSRLPDDDAQARALFDQFSHRFMNKLLHQLTHNLKSRATGEDGLLLAAVARDLFGLEDSA